MFDNDVPLPTGESQKESEEKQPEGPVSDVTVRIWQKFLLVVPLAESGFTRALSNELLFIWKLEDQYGPKSTYLMYSFSV